MYPLIKFKSGKHNDVELTNVVFPLVKHYQIGSKGGYIVVDGTDLFKRNQVRIYTSPLDFEFVETDDYEELVNTVQTKTDEERIVEIAERFEILDHMTKATINGDVRAMIVSGPPGVGKSFTIEREIERACLFDQIAGRKLRHTIVKGSASASGLYKALYEYSDPNSVIVFDDCDSILFDEVALNLLKGALDSGKNRKISWLSESRVLKQEDIPSSFQFKGGVIFLTNLKFDDIRSQRLKDHLEALQSRCHYLDLTLNTMHDKILRIKQIAASGELFEDFNFDQCVQDEIIEFMDENKDKLREMSLRMAIKLAELRKSFPHNWIRMAQTTCMK